MKSSKKLLRRKDVPATYGQIESLRKMISSQNISLRASLKSHDKRFDSIDKILKSHDDYFKSNNKRFDSIDKRFDSVDKRFDSVDKRFDSIDKRFDSLQAEMKAGFAEIKTEIHKFLSLMEDQEARNIRVIDSHNQVSGRLDEVMVEIAGIKKTIGEV